MSALKNALVLMLRNGWRINNMHPLILPLVQLAQKVIPMAFNDNPETKFDLSAALNLALIALLVYLFGFDNAEGIIELSKELQ